jgi:two-component system, cell cycle sensor histidine kinase and response regulator CckA
MKKQIKQKNKNPKLKGPFNVITAKLKSVSKNKKNSPVAAVNISERKRAEEALLIKDAAIESSISAIGLSDLSGKLIFANRAYVNLWGYKDVKDVIGKHISEFAVSKEQVEEVVKTIRTDKSYFGEGKSVRQDGSIFDVQLSANLVKSSNGTPLCLMASFIDITERKRAERDLQNSEKRLSTIYETVGDIIFLLDVEKNDNYRFASVNQMFLKVTGLPLEAIVGKCVREVIPEQSLSMVMDKYKQAIQERTIVRWEETTDYPTGRLIGEVSIAPLFDDYGNCIHLVGAVHDITERKRAEEALLASEELFSTVFNSSPIPISISRVKDNRFLDVNDAWLKITGLSKQEAIGHSSKELHLVPLPVYDEQFKNILNTQGAIQGAECKIQMKSGDIANNMVFAELIKVGNETCLLAMALDITERKQAEEALRQSQESYRKLFEDHSAVKIIIDPGTGFILDANHAAARYYGWTRDELKQMNIEQINTLSSEEVKIEMEKALVNKRVQFEFRHRRADGSVRDVEVYSSKIDMMGKDVLHSIILDTTERKRAEVELQQSELRFATLSDAAFEGIAISDKGQLVDCNEQLMAMMGYKRSEMIGGDVSSFVAPESKQKVLEHLRSGSEEPYEHLALRKDGTIYPVEIRAKSMPYNGKLMRVTVIRDITERKQAEKVLLASEERYRSLFDNASIGIFHSLPEGRFLRVNSALTRMLGYHSPKELIDTITDISTQIYIDSKRRGEIFNKIMNQDEWVYSENHYRRKDGTILVANLAVRKVLSPDGSLAYLEGFVEDITERKQAEEALRQNEERLSSFMNSASDSFYLLDSALNFVEINKRGLEIIGKKKEDVIGKNIDLIVPEVIESGRREKQLEVIRTGKPFIIDHFIPHPIFGNMHFVLTSFKVGDGLGVIAHDITDRKQAELSLMQSEAQLTAFMNFIPALVLIKDHELRLIYTNETYKQFFPADEWIGKKPHVLFPPEIADSMVAEDTDALEKGYASYEENWTDKQGKLHIFFTQKFRINILDKDPLLGAIISDITERKRMEEELAKNETLVRTAVENLPLIFYMIDRDGTFRLSIGAGLKSLGLHQNQVVDQSAFDIYKDYPEITNSIKKSLAGESASFESNVAGSTFSNFLTPIPPLKGTSAGIIGVALDITEQKILQHELLQMQKMDSIGTLAGGIAHDFNNILGIILGYSSMLERAAGENKIILEYIRVIVQAVNRGAALVRQILTFARKTNITLAPVNLSDLVSEIISMLSQTFPKIITFKGIVDKDVPVIDADRTQIHQAMLNLCVNARDAMPRGGSITIKAERQTKTQTQEKFPTADQDAYICISVTDTGEGMDEATRHKIFDPFFTTKEKGKGTGLGLAVVYGVIQSHHGFIDVESEVGCGTTFRLYFPIPSVSELPADISMVAESFTIGGTETILLVEDEEALREMVRLMLESKGYKVFIAQDGNEAFKIFGQHRQEIDIVLTDMGLPGMTGIDVFKNFKQIVPAVSVIFASGFFEPDVKSELYKSGAKGFIQKPYSPDEVLRKIREVLDKKA